MKKIKVLLFLFTAQLFSQVKDTIYFDTNWQQTTKENHAFYRVLPLKQIGELVLIQDFYKNGNLQMQGYVLKENQESYVGDIFWYNEDGTDKNMVQFKNETENNNLIYYYANGNVWKKTDYKEGVKNGETIVYKKDGAVLIKGIYKNGMPYEGSFDTKCTQTEYINTNNQIDANINEDFIETTEQAIAVDSTSYTNTEEIVENTNVKKNTIIEKQFYADTYVLAQEITYSFTEDNFLNHQIIAIKNYDKNGKLIQNITKKDIENGYKIANGVRFYYYTQNDFVLEIAAQEVMKNGEKNGKSSINYLNGNTKQTETFYNGNLEGETVEFNENGTVKSKQIYKENYPYHGNFKIEFNPDVFIYANYVNGKIEGNVLAKTPTDSIITQGIYKNGKPFKGTFFSSFEEFDHNEINSFENFEKNGKQIYFSFDFRKPSLSTTMINGKKEGETIFYNDDGTIKSIIINKNDKMFDGIFTENNKQLTLKNGQLIKVQYLKAFNISEVPQETYTGFYKNNVPFEGYFYNDETEFKTVDYLEKGLLKFQFSNDYLKNIDNYEFPVYDIKTIYENQKVVDGIEYILDSKTLVLKHWKNGILQAIDLDVFAVHYFNRIHFEMKNNSIEVTEYKTKAKIIIEEKNRNFTKTLFYGDTILKSNSYNFLNINTPFIANSMVYYFKINNEIKCHLYILPKRETTENEDENEYNQTILTKIYPNLNFEAETLNKYFSEISAALSSKKIEETFFKKNFDDEENNDDITTLEIDANGKPLNGIQLTKNDSNLYNLKQYSNSKLLVEKENISINEIEKIIKKIRENE